MNITRRSLLGATALGGATLAFPPLATRAQAAPPGAIAGGYTRSALWDDFNSGATIDRSGAGAAGFNWYTDLPWSGGRTPAWCVTTSDSVLTLQQAQHNNNVAISSVSPTTGQGRAFSYGYFEALMSFDTSLGTQSAGCPSFWLLPRSQVVNPQLRHHSEIDVFEAWHDPYDDYGGSFDGTLHDATPKYDGTWAYNRLQNRNNVILGKVRSNTWQLFGCLWRPGEVRWYLDNELMTSVQYGGDRFPSCITWDPSTGENVQRWGCYSTLDDAANEGMVMLFGTGPNWPLRIHWVQVWQQ